MYKKKILLEHDKIYHIYNHANGNEVLFKNDNNYLYFLKKHKEYISPIADTFAYCLMPNHFHIALKIKSEKELFDYFFKINKISKNVMLKDVIDELPKYVSKQFSNLFNAYTKAFNKMFGRKGRLFLSDFNRKLVDNDIYFRKIIHYIHFNPVHHGFVKDLRNWKYSSFETFFSEKLTNLKREQVINWFNDIDRFYEFHKQKIDEQMALELEI